MNDRGGDGGGLLVLPLREGIQLWGEVTGRGGESANLTQCMVAKSTNLCMCVWVFGKGKICWWEGAHLFIVSKRRHFKSPFNFNRGKRGTE